MSKATVVGAGTNSTEGQATSLNSALGSGADNAFGLKAGLRTKLLGYFLALGSLTIVSCTVAILSYGSIAGSFDKIKTKSWPMASHAGSMAIAAANLSAASVMIASARSDSELNDIVKQADASRRALVVSLKEFSLSSTATLTGKDLEKAIRNLLGNIDAQSSRTMERLALSVSVANKVRAVVATHADLLTKLAPILDDAKFNLEVGLQAAIDGDDFVLTKISLSQLSTGELAALDIASELKAESNLIAGILIELSMAPSIELLQPILDRLRASQDRLAKRFSKTTNEPMLASIREPLSALLALADLRTGLAKTREEALIAQKDAWGLSESTHKSSQELVRLVEIAGAAAKSDMADTISQSDDVIETSKRANYVVLGICVLLLVLIWFALGATILRRLAELTSAIVRVAGGAYDISIPVRGRDELSVMGRALETLRLNSISKVALEHDLQDQQERDARERIAREAKERAIADEMQAAVQQIGMGLEQLALGNVGYRISTPFGSALDKLRVDFNEAVAKLSQSLDRMKANGDQVSEGSSRIEAAVNELAKRTEQQAASLEETTAALGEITTMVYDSAVAATKAREAAHDATKRASECGSIVTSAISAMQRIEDSAANIGQIVGVIDEIAFQTNLLALNAGVEAARAGDAGRGFAVVASEVRALAQRSASAAREIKSLIKTSSAQVSDGVSLVEQTGKSLDQILSDITQINNAIGDIATRAEEQSTGLRQVNSAIAEMDKVTQHNASMAQETSQISQTLASESHNQAAMIAGFKTAAVITEGQHRVAA